MGKEGGVLETVVSIAGEISPTLGKSLEGVTEKLDGVNMAALAAGAAVAGIAVATGKALIEGTKYLTGLGDSYNAAVNNISAGTGLVGAELDEMSTVLKDVYGDNFGESMEDAAAGITAIYQATGMTGDALADTTKAAYALSDTFGYEVAESARAAKAMMQNFGVTGEEAMGLIAAGAQNGLDYSGELIDSINEYSVQFSKLGFSADEMFQVFQQGADSGAWNLDKVGDAIKEFSIRSIDGSKTTTEAFTALGLDADEMMATFAAGGDDASIAFQGVVSALMSMDDQVQRDALGVSLFGTQWEDLGVEAVAALADISNEAYDTNDAIGQINEVKYDNLSDAFGSIKRQAEVSLLPLASSIAKAFTDMAPVISELFEELGPIIEQTTEDIMPFVSDFLIGAKDVLSNVIPLVVKLAEKLMPIFSSLIEKLLPPLLDLIEKLAPLIMDILITILPPIVDILLSILPILVQIAQAILPVIVEIIQQFLPVLMPIFDLFLRLLNEVILPLLPPILELVMALLPSVIPILTTIFTSLEPVVDLLSLLAPVLAEIIGFIAKVVDWVSQGLNWVVDLVLGDGAGDIASAASANGYATGGFTNGVSIAGEDPRYPVEAVLSFNPAYREQNLAYWAKAGRMLGADASDFMPTGGGSTTISMGGITFAPIITITGNADKSTIRKAIEEEYPEFLDMLREAFADMEEYAYV